MALLLVLASGMALAVDQKPNSGSCNLSSEDAAGLAHDSNTDMHAVRDYMDTVARLLKQEKFEQLDCLADHARSGKERFSGGMWKIHNLYSALASPVQYPVTHVTQEDWKIRLQHLHHWNAARPNSITARVALASFYIEYAWDARGHSSSDGVSDNGWKLVDERAAEAERILQESLALNVKCPEWYVVMQHVAQLQSWDVRRLRTLFDDAFKFEPDYYYYAQAHALLVEPRWFGAPGDAEKFIEQTADHLGGDKGDIFYFQVANGVVCGCEQDPHLSIEKIERGFEATERQYGSSMLNLNRMAFLASQTDLRDPVFAAKILPRIGEQIDEETWKDPADFQAAKQWAAKWAPRVAKTREIEAAALANMQTPEGAHYRNAFEKPYRELFHQCLGSERVNAQPGESSFKTFTEVGATGTVEAGFIEAMNPVVMCVRQKLGAAQLAKSVMFPTPPQASYWVRLDLDWSEFAPLAAK